MVIFIDESGIHKQTDHSTTAVVYVETKNLEKLEKRILEIEDDLGIKVFHWSDERWLMRNKFLSRIVNLDFKVKVAIFKNPVYPNKMMEIVFNHLITEKEISRIFIDGKKPKQYERMLKKILRDKGASVKKLRTVRKEDSQPGLQLADALAGLIRYHVDNPQKKDAKRWFKRLQREKRLWAQFTFETEAYQDYSR